MKHLRLLLPFMLLIGLMSVVFFVRAVCDPADTGTAGDDTIDCTIANPPVGIVEGLGGDDVIVIDAGVNTAVDFGGDTIGAAPGTGSDTIINNGTIDDVYADSLSGSGSGADTIINNGVSGAIVGDSAGGVGSGADNIINNGTAADIYADSQGNIGSGADTVVNNGNVGVIVGDSVLNSGTGSDTITNNGYAVSIFGDTDTGGVASGNDTIANNGTVGNIYGDNFAGTGTGSDTIINDGAVTNDILAGGGNDSVTIQANDSTVGGTIDGGGDSDTLTFDLRSTSPEQLDAWAAEIAAANPSGGTITLNGNTYTWTNFEDLQSILHLTAIEVQGGIQPFCAIVGGLDIYIAVGDEGSFSLYASATRISDALAYARVYEIETPIEISETSQLWALTTGEVEIRTPEGDVISTFIYQSYCGELPEGVAEFFVAQLPASPPQEELPAYTIVNQPYGG